MVLLSPKRSLIPGPRAITLVTHNRCWIVMIPFERLFLFRAPGTLPKLQKEMSNGQAQKEAWKIGSEFAGIET